MRKNTIKIDIFFILYDLDVKPSMQMLTGHIFVKNFSSTKHKTVIYYSTITTIRKLENKSV